MTLPDLAERLDRLQSMPMFAGITRDQIATALGLMQWQAVRQGEQLVREGDESGHMFLVVDGQFDISVGEAGNRVLVGQARRGDLVGETAIYHSTVYRSASVQAKTPGHVLRFDTTTLDTLARDANPVPQRIELRILRSLPERIRSTLRMIDEVRRTHRPAADDSSSVVSRVKGLLGL